VLWPGTGIENVAYVFWAPLAETLSEGNVPKTVMVSLSFGRMLLLFADGVCHRDLANGGAGPLRFLPLISGFTRLFSPWSPEVLPDEKMTTLAGALLSLHSLYS